MDNESVQIVRWAESQYGEDETCSCECSTCGRHSTIRYVVAVHVPIGVVMHDWFCCTKRCATVGAVSAIAGIDCKGIIDARFRPRRRKPTRVEGSTT